MDIIVPLHIDGAIVGGIEIGINLEETMALIGKLDDSSETAFALLQLSIALAIVGFIWLVLRKGMIGPIRRLGIATEKIAAGDLGARVERTGPDELGRLGQAINQMADSIEELFDEQERAYLGMLQSLAKALEKKDAYTAGHSGRVARFSVMLGRRIELSEQELEILKQGALMHDLGKIGIPDPILNKKGPLDEREYEIMKAESASGIHGNHHETPAPFQGLRRNRPLAP